MTENLQSIRLQRLGQEKMGQKHPTPTQDATLTNNKLFISSNISAIMNKRGISVNLLKKGFQKRGISGVIVTVLLILISIIAVLVLYSLVKGLLREEKELTDAKTEIISFDAEIDKISFSQSKMNITIKRDMGQVTVKNVTVIEHTPIKADIISVVDLSGSMADYYCGDNDTCGLIENNLACVSAGCIWKDKVSQLKNANRDFVTKILGSDNRLGFVAYDKGVIPEFSINLTKSTSDLTDVVDSWVTRHGTCICCGITEAQNRLLNDTSVRKKVIILMSDGGAADDCSGGDPRADAINSSKNAHELGITVHSIGFGNLETTEEYNDTDDLVQIAKEGGGNFYYAYNNQLADVYTKAYTDIFTEYGQETYDHLKVVIYNSTSSCEFKIYNPPLPLETKTYVIDLCVSNPTRIDIYYVIITPSGKEVIGPKVDSWKIG